LAVIFTNTIGMAQSPIKAQSGVPQIKAPTSPLGLSRVGCFSERIGVKGRLLCANAGCESFTVWLLS
jgi:hypothetical protein